MNSQGFETEIRKIDAKFQQDNIPLEQRIWQARCIFSRTTHFIFGDALSSEIDKWYRKIYGPRLETVLKKPFFKIAILINKVPFEMSIPKIFGKRCVNPLSFITDATPKLLNSLPNNELDDICNLFEIAYEASLRMDHLSHSITDDINTAVEQLMQSPQNPGLSKWASSQFAEKILKEYIKNKGSSSKVRNHKLHDIAGEAKQAGLAQIPST